MYSGVEQAASFGKVYSSLYNGKKASQSELQESPMTQLKFIVEQHTDGFVAYPLGLQGAVVGEGDTYDTALADAKSAATFHIQTFGAGAFPSDSPLVDAFMVDVGIDP
jgi:predicted RNase H-like HicB family nuclease